jgi:hypothetical protein
MEKVVVILVDLWSELEVLKEEECSMLMVKVEVSSAHSLVENKIACHCTRQLRCLSPSSLQRKTKTLLLVFILS